MILSLLAKRTLASPANLVSHPSHLPLTANFRAHKYCQAHNIKPTSHSTGTKHTNTKRQMAKKKSSTPAEEHLLLPTPPSALPIVDTHTHIASTFDYYRARYKEGAHTDVYGFVKAMYEGRSVAAVVDVWCEAPVRKHWREFADAAAEGRWGGMEYWFVMGTRVSPFENCPWSLIRVSQVCIRESDLTLIRARAVLTPCQTRREIVHRRRREGYVCTHFTWSAFTANSERTQNRGDGAPTLRRMGRDGAGLPL